MRIVMLLCGLVLAGCGKKEAPPPSEPAAKTAPTSGSVEKLIGDAAPPAPAPVPGAETTAPAAGQTAASGDPGSPADALKTLNAAIKFYVERENAPPKTLQDLLEGGGLKTLPVAPPGMKYIIDRPTLKAKLVKK